MAAAFVLLSALGGMFGALIAVGLGQGAAVVVAAYCLSGFLAAGSACLAQSRRT